MTTATILSDGIHPDLDFGAYRGLDAWGSSALKAMRKGPPARVLWERENETNTDATRFGTAVHCALLTPALFAAQYAVKPDGMSFATKEGKAWRDDPARAGLSLLSWDDGQRLEAIVAAVNAKPLVAAALRKSLHREVSLLATCPDTGERIKGRPDFMDAGFIYDLKISVHAQRPESLSYHAHREGWMHQGAHNRRAAELLGAGLLGVRLVVVSPTAPHYPFCLEVSEDSLDLMALENAMTLKRLGECRRADAWPTAPDEWTRISAAIFTESDVGALDGAEEVANA
jgi:hypothetical protein